MVYQCRLRLTARSFWWSKSREEPWRAQAASTRQSRSNPIFGEIGSTQFLEQGFAPCSFFVFRKASRPAPFYFSQGFAPCSFFRHGSILLRNGACVLHLVFAMLRDVSILSAATNDGIRQSDPSKF